MFKHSAEAVLAGLLLTISLAAFAFSTIAAQLAFESHKIFRGAPSSGSASNREPWESAGLKPSLDEFRFDRAIAAYEALIDESIVRFMIAAK